MTFDSSTLCARTAAGDAELTLPALGLSLGQRRVLSLIQVPSAVDELAQKHHLEPAKLARDLARLADLRLVVLQGAGAKAPAPAPVPAPAPSATLIPDPAAMAAVVIGHSTRRTPALAFAAGTVALLTATAIWYGARSHDTPSVPVAHTEVASPIPSATPIEVPAPPRLQATNDAVTDIVPAATAMILRGNPAPQERPPEIRAVPAARVGNAPPPPAAAPPAPAPIAAPPAAAPSAVPATAPVVAPEARPAAAKAEASPISVANPAPAPSAVAPTMIAAVATPAGAEPPPPVQLAAANPAPAPRAAPVPLKAISREPPEFPKEAIADGLKSGIVTARLHVNARGSVTGVDILGAQPPHVFDRAVRRALIHWQFEPPSAGATADVDVDVKFQRD